MGCCMSTTTKRRKKKGTLHPPPPPAPLKTQKSNVTENPSPAPAAAVVLEEIETVKEVVIQSETPISKALPSEKESVYAKREEAEGQGPVQDFQEPRTQVQNFGEEEEEERTPEISQVSEICSNATDTLSTATTATTRTTVTEIRDEEEVMSRNKRVSRTSPGIGKATRKRPYTGDRSERVMRSPAKRERPQQVKRDVSGPGRATQRNVGSRGVMRKDLGDGSAYRRSRSPAARLAAGGMGKGGRVGGSPAKVAGKAGGRIRESGPGSGVEKEGLNDSVSSQSQPQQQQQQQQGQQQGEGDESLDNPLVSLECFIFL